MSKAKHHVPEGLGTVTPHLVVGNAQDAIAFYKKAFGAELRSHAPGPTPGSTMHAEIRIGDSSVFLMDEPPRAATDSASGTAAMPNSVVHLFVPDADAVLDRAVAAGAVVRMPLVDMFWGDRYGQIRDPFGHVWGLATHKEDVPPDELQRRSQDFFATMSQMGPTGAS